MSVRPMDSSRIVLVGSHQYASYVMHVPPPLVAFLAKSFSSMPSVIKHHLLNAQSAFRYVAHPAVREPSFLDADGFTLE